jgi:hypothetical protein
LIEVELNGENIIAVKLIKKAVIAAPLLPNITAKVVSPTFLSTE